MRRSAGPASGWAWRTTNTCGAIRSCASSVFNTLFYTIVASVIKFALGLWLALLLNRNLPFKSFFRAIVLLPFIVPTALSAIAFWWLYDSQFSIISWMLVKMGIIKTYIDFLGDPWNARLSTVAANIWRGVPFVAICLLAGLQTISPSLYEAAALDGATPWQRFRFVTLPLLTPIIAVVMTFSVLFTFTDFQLIYVITRGGPLNATHLMATLSFQRAISGGSLGEGAALATMMIPFLLAAILFSYFGLQRRKWQQGATDKTRGETIGPSRTRGRGEGGGRGGGGGGGWGGGGDRPPRRACATWSPCRGAW